jgi:uncharacterized protein
LLGALSTMRKLKSFTVLIGLVALVSGCATSTTAPKAVAELSGPAPLMLWKVTSDKRPSDGYILGSVHLGRSSDSEMDSAIREAYESSVALIVEVDEDRYDSSEIQQLTMMKAAYPRGDSIINHVSTDTLALLGQTFSKIGLPVKHFMRFKPWFLSLTASVLVMTRAGYSPDNGIDKRFITRARAEKKPIGELESPEYQIDVLSSLAPEQDEENMRHTLAHIDEIGSEIEKIRNAYFTGNVEAMAEIVSSPSEENQGVKEYMEKVMYSRNRTMSQSIDRLLMDPGPYFIVIGVGHLVGDRTVLNYLKDKGYGIERVVPKGIPKISNEPTNIP